jgi:hypothetical protein
MRNLLIAAGLVAIAAATNVEAQQGGAMMQSAPGSVGVAQTARMEATVTAVDAASRAVTLKGAQGREITVVAAPEVRNFGQIRVGDKVEAEYVEALTIDLHKGGGKTVARTESAGAAGAKPGAKPAAMGGRQVTVVADVVAVDPATQVVTLKGPQRTVDLKVRDPAQFKLVAVGDQVEATYTEAVAVAVRPKK